MLRQSGLEPPRCRRFVSIRCFAQTLNLSSPAKANARPVIKWPTKRKRIIESASIIVGARYFSSNHRKAIYHFHNYDSLNSNWFWPLVDNRIWPATQSYKIGRKEIAYSTNLIRFQVGHPRHFHSTKWGMKWNFFPPHPYHSPIDANVSWTSFPNSALAHLHSEWVDKRTWKLSRMKLFALFLVHMCFWWAD